MKNSEKDKTNYQGNINYCIGISSEGAQTAIER